MKTRYCRICFTNRNDLAEICKETRENFLSLTNIHLLNSRIHSNFICQDCKNKLQSTKDYVRLLVENEIRLTDEFSQDSLALNEDQNFPDIKIEDDDFEADDDQANNDVSSNSSRSKSQLKKNQVRKRRASKITIQSSSKLKTSTPSNSHQNYEQSTEDIQSKCQNEDFSQLPTTKNGKIICPDCNRPILKVNYKDHINQKHVGDNIFICDLCLKKFHRKYSLECHMHVHLKIQPYKCPENCGKSFYSKHGLYFHYKMHHQPINEFICEICAKSFKQSHLLQEHIDAKHDGVRYKCKYDGCGNQYDTISGLKKHIISIHECKIVPCEYCGELFRTGFSLYQHIRINHKERKFVCEYEGCDKKFVIKTHYRDHLKMHTGNKDFICNLCDARYHKKRNLNRHIEVVHQKSRFFCQIAGCNASLCNKDNYRAHLRKVHTDNPETRELLAGIAKIKPIYLENADEAVQEQN